MKTILGMLTILLGVALAALLGLRIWGVSAASPATLLRSGATLAVVAVAFGGLLVAWFAFFNNPAAGYDTRVGRHAHPRRGLPPEPGE